MQTLLSLTAGDWVEIIAPASRCSDVQLNRLHELLNSWGLNCKLNPSIFAKDLLCANSDEARFNYLKQALYNPDIKAIICARGGYGSMRLIPDLIGLQPPTVPKLFIGMSDITALHLFLQQKWQWPSVHAALNVDQFSKESIKAVQDLLFGRIDRLHFQGLAMNSQASIDHLIQAPIVGGNLSLVQCSMGTSWQIDAKEKIIFLEEVGERAYRVDRMLEHLRQMGLFEGALALIIGDFLKGEEPDGSSLIEPVLQRFADRLALPVVNIPGIGHGHINFPLPLGIEMNLQLGRSAHLKCRASSSTFSDI